MLSGTISCNTPHSVKDLWFITLQAANMPDKHCDSCGCHAEVIVSIIIIVDKVSLFILNWCKYMKNADNSYLYVVYLSSMFQLKSRQNMNVSWTLVMYFIRSNRHKISLYVKWLDRSQFRWWSDSLFGFIILLLTFTWTCDFVLVIADYFMEFAFLRGLIASFNNEMSQHFGLFHDFICSNLMLFIISVR